MFWQYIYIRNFHFSLTLKMASLRVSIHLLQMSKFDLKYAFQQCEVCSRCLNGDIESWTTFFINIVYHVSLPWYWNCDPYQILSSIFRWLQVTIYFFYYRNFLESQNLCNFSSYGLWSDCADAQTYLNLRCMYLQTCTLCLALSWPQAMA